MYNGTVVFNEWKVPVDQSGGEYTIKVSTRYHRVPASIRKFRIGSISQPALFVTLDFDKNAYSIGEAVQGKVKVRKPDGEKLPVGSSIAFNVEDTKQSNITLDRQGEVTINFTVPSNSSIKVLTVSVSTYLGYS